MNKIIGALWKKEKDGKTYYSGVLQDFRGNVNIAVFPNNYKEKDNQPDMNIIISFGFMQNELVNAKSNGKGKSKKNNSEVKETDDDIPF